MRGVDAKNALSIVVTAAEAKIPQRESQKIMKKSNKENAISNLVEEAASLTETQLRLNKALKRDLLS